MRCLQTDTCPISSGHIGGTNPDGTRRGQRRGKEEGRTEEARRGVLRVIERRFGEVPPDLRTRMEGLSALDRLEHLLDQAMTCASLAEFRELLENSA